jgi:hypothetical protein
MSERAIPGRIVRLAAIILASISAIGFLLISAEKYGLGFPLDDAWIHQTYARNIVELGEWSYVPGVPSGGSTSPLWTIGLAFGNVLRIDPKAWTYFVGILILSLIGMVGCSWLNLRGLNSNRWHWLVIIILAWEWHLTWAAVSGMETIAIALLFLFTFLQLEKQANEFLIGLLLGIGLWLRPGAITLFLPVALYTFDRYERDVSKWLRGLALVALGFLILSIPYLLLNYSVAGSVWPNTFFAKQAEYAIEREASLIIRFLEQLVQPLFIGIGIALLPGILIVHLRKGRKFSISHFGPLLWVIAYLGTYALRLPVTYQHGRYAIPTIPVLIVLGIEGFIRWADTGSSDFAKRFLSRTWLLVSLGVLIAFWVVGARAYAQDVAIIETEMVAPSTWIAANTEPDAVIAAHDIGALGYFGQRNILDLAGLVSPEVVPFIRDEEQLSAYITERGADYLMTFPGWYPRLSLIGEPLYQSDGQYSPQAGGENMEILRWP